MSAQIHRSIYSPMATAAWKLVMHQGVTVAIAADQLKTSPRRVESLLLALARRRAGRMAT